MKAVLIIAAIGGALVILTFAAVSVARGVIERRLFIWRTGAERVCKSCAQLQRKHAVRMGLTPYTYWEAEGCIYDYHCRCHKYTKEGQK